jgi:predicted RNA binding protein YcfA (HicA-like mRNA interferase family)
MKIPRNITGQNLIKILKKYGYSITNQTGSHIKITSEINSEHHITIPNHVPLKIGTLNAILNDLSNYPNIPKDTLIKELFE